MTNLTGVNYPGNTDHLNWKEEVKALKAANVNVFPMQCLLASIERWSISSGKKCPVCPRRRC
jgi:hypothetical protein